MTFEHECSMVVIPGFSRELSGHPGIDHHTGFVRWANRKADLMFGIWKSWVDAAEFGFEAQSVVALRLMKIAAGGPSGAAEYARMVSEKFIAAAAAHSAGAIALASGKSFEAATVLALAPVKSSVRANHRRLSRG